MKQFLIATTLALSVIVSSSFARAQAVQSWALRHHESDSDENRPLAIAVDSSGNAIVTGTSRDTNFFDLKHWVTIAYSSSGAPLWTNRYHGPGSFYDDQPNAVAVDAAGNSFVAGVAFNMAGDQDYVVIKYSPAGVALWTRRYNGPGNGNDGANAIAIDGTGNVIVTGLSVGTNGLSSFFDCATVKYSNAGVPLWTNRYNGPANNEDAATDVVVDSSGNVFVTGYSFTSDGTPDYLTLAYSSAGVPLWTNRFNGAGNNSDYARAVAVDRNGNVFVTGESWNGSATDFATIKYSVAGTPLWTNRYHGPLAANNFATAIAVDTNGNVFVTGGDGSFANTNGGYTTIKYSNIGVPLWTNHFNAGYSDNARAIAVDGNGNIIVTGQSYRDFVTSDIVTVAYSNAGLPLWTNRYNGPVNGNDVPLTKRSLALGPTGSVYLTGASESDYFGQQIFDFATVKYASPAPSLFIVRSNASVILSWPVTSLNLQLQACTNVSLSNSWSFAADTRSTNNGFISVTIPATNSSRFFRLASQ